MFEKSLERIADAFTIYPTFVYPVFLVLAVLYNFRYLYFSGSWVTYFLRNIPISLIDHDLFDHENISCSTRLT